MKIQKYGNIKKLKFKYKTIVLKQKQKKKRVHNITESGKKVFSTLGISRAFDLRSKIEHNTRGSVEENFFPNATVCQSPIFEEEDYSPLALAERWGSYAKGPDGFYKAYMTILEKGSKQICDILKHLSMATNGTLIFCTAVTNFFLEKTYIFL